MLCTLQSYFLAVHISICMYITCVISLCYNLTFLCLIMKITKKNQVKLKTILVSHIFHNPQLTQRKFILESAKQQDREKWKLKHCNGEQRQGQLKTDQQMLCEKLYSFLCFYGKWHNFTELNVESHSWMLCRCRKKCLKRISPDKNSFVVKKA